jgi:D-alanine-D-alanine ligase
LYIRQDKGLAKKLLKFDNILFPDFAIFPKDADFETGGNLRPPLFVKPLRTDASIGIDGTKALVRNFVDLGKRIEAIHKKLNDAAIAEEYIEGREFYVGVLGNLDPVAFPPIEMDFSGLPAGRLRVMDQQAKFATRSAAYKGTKPIVPELESELAAKLKKVAVDACRALRVRDYGRVDLRLTDTGDIYVIEVNANCYLKRESEFVMAAKEHGLDYPTLINRIAELALKRHQESR